MVSKSDTEKEEDRGTETQRDTKLNDYIGFTLRKGRWSEISGHKSSGYEYRAQIPKGSH